MHWLVTLVWSGRLYSVRITKVAKSDISRLDRTMSERVIKRIRWLADNYETIVPQPLAGTWQDYFKLRVGDYRVIYRVEQEESPAIIIEFVRHRREVYK